jgi:subtilisin family serine protease
MARKSSTPAKGRISTPAGQQSAAIIADEPRPGYIVVFRQPAEANLRALSEVLKLKPIKESPRAGVLLMEPQRTNRARVRLYRRLGVAVADLNKREAVELESSAAVVAVVPNQRRTLPPPVPVAGELAVERLRAYLAGMRDAIDATLRFLDGAHPSVPDFSIAERAAHSWSLELLGIGPDYRLATGKGVTAAVLDTGVDFAHPDFAGGFREGDNAVSFVPGEGAQDGHGHGTHCAGLLAGPSRSQGGMRYGVAPDVEILIGKVLDNNGSGFDDQILDGIDWALERGARILSLSLGSAREVDEPYSPLYETVAASMLAAEPGALLVAAVGNESNRPFYTRPVGNPAACPSVLGVAAIDREKRIGAFSSRQMDSVGEVNMSAPGVAVYSTWAGGGFRTLSGTSMATPQAAGVAALYLEHSPQLAARVLWQALTERALPLGDPHDYGRGLVQAPA